MRRTVALEGMQVLAKHLGNAPKEWLLTYIEELLAMDTAKLGISDLRKHADATLAEAAASLTKESFQAARERILKDARLD